MAEESYITVKDQPHEEEHGGCGSSDALQIYSDGHAFCYSCNAHIKNYEATLEKEVEDEQTKDDHSFSVVEPVASLVNIRDYPYRGCRDRLVDKRIYEHFGATTGPNGSQYYPYTIKGEVVAYKERKQPKAFQIHGEFKGVELFGQSLFREGGKRIVIFEGELDAMSYAQACLDQSKTIYPAVSIPSASGTKVLREQRDYLRSFEEVILWFDNDDAGQKAKDAAAKIIGYDKVKVVKAIQKDASDVLTTQGHKEVMRCVWDAKPYSPAGLITDPELLWQQLEEYNQIESVPYPPCLEGLNDKVRGMRFGEITLWTSGTGSGKSTLLREIMLHLVENTDDKIGLVSLEEAPAEAARKLAGMAIERNPAKEEIPLEDLRPGFDKVFADQQVIVLDHQGSIQDGSIVDTLEAMCVMGAKYLFIDHITILVSEGADGLTGNEAIDKTMNDLLSIAKRHNVWIGLVSHLRKMTTVGSSFEDGKLASLDDIRGSGSIKQVSFDILAFARDLNAADEEKRNTIKMAVLKSRYTGLTGPCGTAKYIYDTGRLVYGGFEEDMDADPFSVEM